MQLNRKMNDRQFANSLYQSAAEQGEVEVVFDNVMDIRQILERTPELGNVLLDPRLEKAKRELLLEEFTANFSQVTQAFIYTIYQFGRTPELSSIVDEFEKIYDKKNRTLVAKVTTAIPMSEEQKKRLAEVFAIKMGAKKVVFRETIDDAIIGGVIIETESQVFDGSIRHRLEQLKRKLV